MISKSQNGMIATKCAVLTGMSTEKRNFTIREMRKSSIIKIKQLGLLFKR